MDNVKDILCKSALHYHNSKWLPYKYDINVYRGCSHRCIYCYALYTHEYIDGGSFYNDIFAKTNVTDVLEGELMSFARQTVNLGGVCDSYQHAERNYKLMPALLGLLSKHNVPVVLSTKSTLVLRDIELLEKMDARVAFTVTTMDETVAKLIEPGAPSPMERIAAVKQLTDNGVKCGVHLMPIIPYLTSSDQALEAVFRAAKGAGADYVLAGALNLRGRTRQGFFDSVKSAFPSEYSKIFGLYKDKEAYIRYKQHVMRTLEFLRKQYRMPNFGKVSVVSEAEQLSFL